MPIDVTLPPIWLLGSSDYSAELAAQVGAGFSFAHHFSDFPPDGPMLTYRNQFKPSAWRQTPYAILGVAAISPIRTSRLTAGEERRPAFRAPCGGTIRSPRLAGGSRRLCLHADRPPAHRRQSQAADRRLAEKSKSASTALMRPPSRRGDDHHDGVRSRGAEALLRAAGEGVCAQGVAAPPSQNGSSPTLNYLRRLHSVAELPRSPVECGAAPFPRFTDRPHLRKLGANKENQGAGRQQKRGRTCKSRVCDLVSG